MTTFEFSQLKEVFQKGRLVILYRASSTGVSRYLLLRAVRDAFEGHTALYVGTELHEDAVAKYIEAFAGGRRKLPWRRLFTVKGDAAYFAPGLPRLTARLQQRHLPVERVYVDDPERYQPDPVPILLRLAELARENGVAVLTVLGRPISEEVAAFIAAFPGWDEACRLEGTSDPFRPPRG